MFVLHTSTYFWQCMCACTNMCVYAVLITHQCYCNTRQRAKTEHSHFGQPRKFNGVLKQKSNVHTANKPFKQRMDYKNIKKIKVLISGFISRLTSDALLGSLRRLSRSPFTIVLLSNSFWHFVSRTAWNVSVSLGLSFMGTWGCKENTQYKCNAKDCWRVNIQEIQEHVSGKHLHYFIGLEHCNCNRMIIGLVNMQSACITIPWNSTSCPVHLTWMTQSIVFWSVQIICVGTFTAPFHLPVSSHYLVIDFHVHQVLFLLIKSVGLPTLCFMSDSTSFNDTRYQATSLLQHNQSSLLLQRKVEELPHCVKGSKVDVQKPSWAVTSLFTHTIMVN